MNRVERLLNLVAALLEAPRPLTVEDIRERVAGYDAQPSYDAFRRAFERDKSELKELGIPLETVEIDPFDSSRVGYRIPKSSYYLPDIDLEPEELAALKLASQALMGSGLHAEAGVMKLAAVVTPGSLSEPRVPPFGADLAAEQPLLASLYEAYSLKQRVRFTYQRAGGEETSVRTLETHGLVHRRGNWYVVGRDVERDAVRSFRLSRIRSKVELLPETYELPADADPAERVDLEPWEVGPDEPIRAVVRFDPELAWWPAQNLPGVPLRTTQQGAAEVELTVANLDALVNYALGFGAAVEIVAPPEARARLVEHLAPYLEGGGG